MKIGESRQVKMGHVFEVASLEMCVDMVYFISEQQALSPGGSIDGKKVYLGPGSGNHEFPSGDF
jgi:hypothetical protein